MGVSVTLTLVIFVGENRTSAHVEEHTEVRLGRAVGEER